MAKEVSPYSIRHTRPPRRAQLTVLAEDVESNIQEDLHQYWRIARKHLGFVLAVPAVFLGLMVLRDMAATPLYTASSTLLIRNSSPPLLENATVTIVSSQNTDSDSEEQDQTQIQLLKSRTLAARVVRNESLASDPALVGAKAIGPIGTWWRAGKQLLAPGFRGSGRHLSIIIRNSPLRII
jgi:uncharacterized protein involved in exopolysaccharide biosynthesis